MSGYATAAGPHTVTFSAADGAGNTATASRSYTVSPWRLAGFTAPVDMGGMVNVARGGSTVPLKFEMFAGDVELTDPAAIGTVFSARASACSGAPSDEVEFVTTRATELR